MSKFRVTVPVTIYVSYTIEAVDEEAAIDAKPPAQAIYSDAGGGLSPQRGVSIFYAGPDAWDWEQAEAEER